MSAGLVTADPAAAAGGVERKARGVYYTPPQLAELLVDWGLQRRPERILEPSYGDGVFLRKAHEKLRELDVPAPEQRLFGVEIDPLGPGTVADLRVDPSHLHCSDLLALRAEDLGGMFDAILGNPPYIRHHLLPRELIERGRASASEIGIELNGRSDAWAYFCAHLVTFLAPGGRLALVLPGSVLHADYAKPLLVALARKEGEVQLIRIKDRLFPGVQERTVILLIDRARPSGRPVSYRSVSDLRGLKRALRAQGDPPRSRRKDPVPADDDPRLSWRLSAKEAAIWDEVSAEKRVAELGELTKVRIGVVTGANSFFIRSKKDLESLAGGLRSVPIISRGGWLRAPVWSAESQAAVAELPSRLLLLPDQLPPQFEAVLKSAEEEEIHLRSHCERRTPWYSIIDSAAPDLFLPYMGSQAPRIVLNEAGATCTNAIHRLWLHPETSHSAMAIAAASWTTLYRLSAELMGRSYGGGVLKVEPRGATSLRMALTAEPEVFAEIQGAHEDGGVEAARLLADRRLLIEGLGMSKRDVSAMAIAATRLAATRRS